MFCTVLGWRGYTGCCGEGSYLSPFSHRADGLSCQLTHSLQWRHAICSPPSLLVTASREIAQQFLIPQHHFPKLLMKHVLKAEQVPEMTFFSSSHIPTSCFYARSPDHLPSVFTGEVCPVCLELHHVQWRRGVHLQEQPVRLPVRGGVPAVQLPHHRHPDHGVHVSKHGQDLDRSL